MQESTIAKTIASLTLLTCLALAPSVASAQSFGSAGGLGIFAERMFGAAIGEREFEQGQNSNRRSEDFKAFSLFTPIVTNGTAYPTLLTLPRIGFDYFVVDSVSVGGALAFSLGDDDTLGNRGLTGFLFAPRAGWVYMFNQSIGIWLRGGFTFTFVEFSDDNSNDDDDDIHQFGINLEAQFPFFVTDSLAFTAGVTTDIGVTGERFGSNRDYEEWAIGLSFGMLGFIGL